MVSTRSSAAKSTFFTPFNVKSLKVNSHKKSVEWVSHDRPHPHPRRTSPRLRAICKSSPAPKENTNVSTPRRSPRIRQLHKWDACSTTRSGHKYGRGYVNPRSVKPRDYKWGQWTHTDSDNWNPAAWAFSSNAVPAWP